LHFHQQHKRVPFSPASLPSFVVIFVIEDSHFDWGEVKYQCHFDLHFLYGQAC
jgi:hypothetical protein